MAGLGSSNVANTLLQTLQNLNAQSDQIVMSKETANVVASLCSICAVLADSAEAVAEATANPTVQQQLLDYSANVKEEMASLSDLKKAIEANPNAPGLKQRLIAAGRKIADLTANMIVASENMLVKRVIEDARACAKQAKALIMAVQGSFEAFFETCKQFGASSVALAKSLKDLIADIEDPGHKQRIHKAYEDIRDAGTRLVKAASVAFENPGNKECLAEVQTVGRELAAKIGVAIAIAQPDAEATEVDGLSLSAPTVPIAVEAQDMRTRKPTIRDPKQGTDILNKARTASAMNDITQTLTTPSSPSSPSASPASAPAPAPATTAATPKATAQPPAMTATASAFIPPVAKPAPGSSSTPSAVDPKDRSVSPRPGTGANMLGSRGLSPQRSDPTASVPLRGSGGVQAGAAIAKRPDSEVGTAASPLSQSSAAQRSGLTQSASAFISKTPSTDRPSSDRPASAASGGGGGGVSAAAVASAASSEMDALKQRNAQLEKEVAQLKSALAEAKKEAEQWREEFDGLNKAVAGVAQRMGKKT